MQLFRWVEAHGGQRIIAIGRREVLSIYLKVGLRPLGRTIRSGAVTFELLAATVPEVRAAIGTYAAALERYRRRIAWRLPIPYQTPLRCLHGGASFDAVGDEFDHLEARHRVINADVLDAWFPPSPRAVTALQTELPWLVRTSPPTGCEGLVRVIARRRGVPEECILPGGGSSDLIYLALREWLTPAARALVLDPTYGEYEHLLEHVIGCTVDPLVLERADGYVLRPERLAEALRREYDLVVLVNPNSPTGRHVRREVVEQVLAAAPERTRVWVDETYLEYAGTDQSLEPFAAASRGVVVCKSLSKVYALSGARAAYLCGPAEWMAALRRVTPPWTVSLLAQVAAVNALQDTGYYAACWAETHRMREELAASLRVLGLDVVPSVTNFLLCHLGGDQPTAAHVIKLCRDKGLFLRDAGTISPRLGDRAIRLAVKDADTNRWMLDVLKRVLGVP